MAKDRKIDMVILGLLAHEKLSGYEIKKRIDNGISFFWKGSFGSIYPSLAAMEKDGLVIKIKDGEAHRQKAGQAEAAGCEDENGYADAADSEEKACGREKNVYSITEKGMKALHSWLSDSKAANDLKYETLLKVFFGSVAETELTVNAIREFEQEISRSLAVLKVYRENLSRVLSDKTHLHYYLTVSFGVTAYEGYLKWCKEALRLLK